MSQKTIARLERLHQLNSNRQWINHDLYRLMYQEDLYIIAYERIKSKPGNMTPGEKYTRWEAVFPRDICTSAHSSRRVLTCRPKI
jgi:hypothetical protein